MKILLVGGLGFIGHHVAKILIEQGHECTIFDNLTTYNILDQKKHSRLLMTRLNHLGTEHKFHFVKGDIDNIVEVSDVFGNNTPDIVIHLASYPRAKIVNNDPITARQTMLNGTEGLLNLSARFKVKRFVFISSSMVYGNFKGGVTEDAECKPGSIYATYKLAGEQITQFMAKKHEFEYTIIRPSTVYGPRDVDDRVVSTFFANAFNDKCICVNGEDERLDFTYVTDIADGIAKAAISSAGANQIFNITHGNDETILNAANTIKEITNSKSEIIVKEKNPNMPSRGYLNIHKAIQFLDYSPGYSIDEGFMLYNDWVQNSVFPS